MVKVLLQLYQETLPVGFPSHWQLSNIWKSKAQFVLCGKAFWVLPIAHARPPSLPPYIALTAGRGRQVLYSLAHVLEISTTKTLETDPPLAFYALWHQFVLKYS